MFGSTEALVTNLSHAEQFTHPASVGRPIPGVEVRLVDDAGRDVPDGEVGELAVQERRARTVRDACGRTSTGPRRPPRRSATAGSIPVISPGSDADGYLYIVDRKKDMVLSGGYQHLLEGGRGGARHASGVAEAAVIGVPDEVYGEAVAAFVELAAAARTRSPGTDRSLPCAARRATKSRSTSSSSTRSRAIRPAKCSRTSSARWRPRGSVDLDAGLADHAGVLLAVRGDHRQQSFGRRAGRFVAELAVGVARFGRCEELRISASSFATTSGGVPAGANIANQTTMSKPGTPCSATVGASGMSGERSPR